MVQAEVFAGIKRKYIYIPRFKIVFMFFFFFSRIAIITKDGVERRLFLNNELPSIGEFSYSK